MFLYIFFLCISRISKIAMRCCSKDFSFTYLFISFFFEDSFDISFIFLFLIDACMGAFCEDVGLFF